MDAPAAIYGGGGVSGMKAGLVQGYTLHLPPSLSQGGGAARRHHADDDDEEVEAVPAVVEVRALPEHEAHGKHLDEALREEDNLGESDG
jgi:hypothetical protein